jgi:excisionase family DNA binding protein
MSNYADVPDLPGYVSVEEAAKRLGISKTRVYGYINDGRLRAVKASQTLMIPVQEIENYKRNITGRPRKSTPIWRIPPKDNDLHITLIFVEAFPDKINILKKRLIEIKTSENFIFPGTIARYISQSETQPGRIEIELVWRGAAMPDEPERERELEAFRQKLADVLDWSKAQYSNSKILLHT